mmetsp:Transcript_53919/g.95174  ORF Transcript_53919/g.95174 Transcript_53919/m.95174 type:complete len:146 (-) Transcript_53919:322-759(-)
MRFCLLAKLERGVHGLPGSPSVTSSSASSAPSSLSEQEERRQLLGLWRVDRLFLAVNKPPCFTTGDSKGEVSSLHVASGLLKWRQVRARLSSPKTPKYSDMGLGSSGRSTPPPSCAADARCDPEVFWACRRRGSVPGIVDSLFLC